MFEILDEFEVIKGTRECTTMFPHLMQYADGALRVVFNTTPDQHYALCAALESRDGGKTWQEAPHPVPAECAYAVLADGTAMGMCCYLFPDTDGYLFGHRWVSKDNGKTLEGPEEIKVLIKADDLKKAKPGETVFHGTDICKPTEFYQNFLGEKCAPAAACHLWDKALELEDGALYLGVQVNYARDRVLRTQILISKDKGATWEVFSEVSSDQTVGNDGVCEPGIAIAANGDWLSATRTGDPSPLRLYRSKDAGKTWDGGAIVADFGVDPKLERLSDGTLVLLYGRPNCWMKISKDDGLTWSVGRTVQFHADTTSYMGICEVEPNVIMVAYNDEMFPQQKRIDGGPAYSIKIKKMRIL
jgi:hypothetical protein